MLGDDLTRCGTHASESSSQKSPFKKETFELSEKEHPYLPVSTTKILGKFTRDPPPDIPDSDIRADRETAKKQHDTVEDLRKWAKNRESSTAFKMLSRTVFWQDVKVRMPSEDKIYRAIHHFYPPRAELTVTVCDFGPGRAEQKLVRLGEIENGKALLRKAWDLN